ncbi:hypothetical protein [Paraburkholderia diazotrophica]|uniref:Uncharacterized protein n=1 Tax=Paraburkholderia diazotrophica TaxID=667676 RepID=A0A1H6Y8P7_9BURK|nr:hypothetical protein [Paraburkholderia diazotrophica]SEJ33572.1 hypothetical protein SAMN05192539_1009140 [Paraburkholderia diazotrophica]
MNTDSTRISDTQVRIANKQYSFRSRDEADRFVQCLENKEASHCIAECPPDTTSDVSPNQPGEGITIGPPPGVLDSEE